MTTVALDREIRLGLRRRIDERARRSLDVEGGYDAMEERERQRDVELGLRPASWRRPQIDHDYLAFLLAEGLSQVEIATEMGVSPSAVCHAIRRQRLR